MKEKFTNALSKASSPYLLQHAHNPVDWHPWEEELLRRAQEENKLLLISIGYAACHWCHVMEEESFEDEEVAMLMNTNFINIKVDREERPDIDQIYMNAVQLMTGSGGWPLNVVALPDGRPIWGGTYFKPQQWMHLLNQLAKLHETTPDTLEEYAQQLQEGIINSNTITPKIKTPIHYKEIATAVKNWTAYFDEQYGGTKRAPKFMMPVNVAFLLYYGTHTQDKQLLNYVDTTLTKMAYGGIYDHVGGGFSRYSVDEKWHVPHFEKMLYDNAQLVSLYSNAYRATKNKRYKTIVEETLSCIQQEFTNPYGAFYSSLDADSKNEAGVQEEGAFYVWKKRALQELLKEDFSLFADYYNINSFGLWEGENYILIQNTSEEEIAQKNHCTVKELSVRIRNSIQILFQARNERHRPRLDDKTLTSWNALMLKAYADAYKAFSDKTYLDTALKNAQFLLKYQHKEDGGLYHSFKNKKSSINGFLEDYAAVCDAFISLYEASGDQKWLIHAKAYVHYCYDHFYDQESGFFFFTHTQDPVIVSKTIEKADNVIPASNSIMAKVLFKLSRYFHNNRYEETAQNMLYALKDDILLYPYSHANWLSLALHFCTNFYEIAISGKATKHILHTLNTHYLPHAIVAIAEHETTLPLLKNKTPEDKAQIYVCQNNHCKLPVTTVQEAIHQLYSSHV